jgi:DedD protein
VDKPEAKTDPKADTKTDAKSDAKDAPRFIVQVGAFSDEAKMRDVRAKVEKSGFKTYTHVAETKEGKRTRVRVGPFATREEADKVANKIKQLQLQPQVLTL